MRYYTTTTEFNCGIDLHARSMYACLVDRDGKKLFHQNIRDNDFAFFLKKIAAWRHSLTVCCECLFCWYWLADACQAAGIHFVLAHPLYVRAIHGGKNKNDRIDSEKLAHLLRSNLIPPAYVYPAKKRPLRALLRQRITYVWRRAELLQRLECFQLAEGKQPVAKGGVDRFPWLDRLHQAFPNPYHQLSLETDLTMVRHYDTMIGKLEIQLVRATHRVASRNYSLLKTVPGIGQSLALTILYEVDDINRFPTVQRFSSYCRLVKGTVASAGKIKGLRGAKMGNPYLRWAMGEAAVLAKRHHPLIRLYADALEAKVGKFKANAILANKIARAVYFMLKNGTGFDIDQFLAHFDPQSA
jgi:transposase